MAALETMLAERASRHGDFTEQARVSQAFKAVAEASPGWQRLSPVQREGTAMILHKLSRVLAGDPNFRDHWDDIAGYARITSDRCAEPEGAAGGYGEGGI